MNIEGSHILLTSTMTGVYTLLHKVNKVQHLIPCMGTLLLKVQVQILVSSTINHILTSVIT